MDRYDIIKYVEEKYGTIPENPWIKDPESTVLRHSNNAKWYGLIMKIQSKKLGLNDGDNVEILNVKSDPILIESLIDNITFFKAYHMNRIHWMTVLLKNVQNEEEVFNLISLSFDMTD